MKADRWSWNPSRLLPTMLIMFQHMFLPHCRSAAPWPSPLHEPISLLLLIKWRFTTAMWKTSPSRCGVGVRCGHVCTRTYTHTHIRTYMDWVEVCTCLSVCLSVCLPVYLKAKEKEKKGSKPGKDEDKPNLKKSAGELPVVRADWMRCLVCSVGEHMHVVCIST